MITRFLETVAARLRVAALVVAAAMIGAGGAAALTVASVSDSSALPGASETSSTATADPGDDQGENGDDQGENGDDQGDATETAAPDPTETGDPSEPVETEDPSSTDPAPVPPLDPEACAAAANHGEYVSHIAHLTQGQPDHGAQVAAAAHSDCGKGLPEVTSTDGSSDSPEARTSREAKAKSKHQAKVKTHGRSGEHGKGSGRHKTG